MAFAVVSQKAMDVGSEREGERKREREKEDPTKVGVISSMVA